MPPRRRNKGLLEPPFAALVKVFERLGLADQAIYLKVRAAWPRAVGTQIAEKTVVSGFVRGKLLVKARSATWQHQLNYLRAEIIAKLNEQLQRPWVKEVRIVGGFVPEDDPRAAPLSVDAPSASDVAQASECARVIDDEATRVAFTSLMAKALRRQQRQP